MDIRAPTKLKNIGTYTSIESRPNSHLSNYYANLKNSGKTSSIFEQLHRFEQSYVEKYILQLSVNKLCQNLVDDRYDLDVLKIINNSQKNFYDPQFLRALSCYSSYSIFINSPYSHSEQNKNIYAFWEKIRAIASGSYGTVYESTKQEQDKAFLIKVPDKSADSVDIYHEIFIGFILNRYRDRIPNFMYTYGYMDVCGSLTTTKLSKVKDLCLVKGKNIYTIIERINGITLSEYLHEGTDTRNFIKIYLQLILALYTVRDIHYVHHDLHTKNVVMRDLPQTVLAPYKFGTKTIYIETDQIPTIIDYGYSYLKMGDKDFGVSGLEDDSVYWDRYHPIMDSFKLLMFMIENFKDEIERPIEHIVEFFDNESDAYTYSARYHDMYEDYLFNIPVSEKTAEYTHESLINYILDNNDLLTDPEKSKYQILGSEGRDFKYTDYVVNDGINYNSFSFLDMMIDNRTNKNKIINKYNFHVNSFLKNDLNDFKANITYIESLTSEITEKSYVDLKLLNKYVMGSVFGPREENESKIEKLIPNITDFFNKINLAFNVIQKASIQRKSIEKVLYNLKINSKLYNEGKVLNIKINSLVILYKKMINRLNVYLKENELVYSKGYSLFGDDVSQFIEFISKNKTKIEHY